MQGTTLKEMITLQFMQIIVDFITLGALGLFSTITLGVWYCFVDAFVFEQGYFKFINRFKLLKVLLIMISGIFLWGSALLEIHVLLWGPLP